MKPSRFVLSILLLGVASMSPKDSAAAGYADLRARAEKFYEEKSFRQSHELYEQAANLSLSPSEKIWVTFRRADTAWREESSGGTPDNQRVQQSRETLQALLNDKASADWPEATRAWINESLGDSYWEPANSRNWYMGWNFYQKAYELWAGSTDLETARREYLRLSWKVLEPPSVPEYYTYGYYGNWLPVAVARNVARLAVTPDDRARAQYLLALSLRQQGGRSALVIDAFEKSLAAAKTAYYDDALFALAQTYENGGRRVRRDGRWEEEPDYVKALALYQRLTKEFKKSESRYWDQAQESAKNITEPELSVSVGNMFLPNGKPTYQISWRNVTDVKFRLEKMDPLADFAPKSDDSPSNWVDGLRKGGKTVRQWEKALTAPEHAPGNETVTMEEPLPAGAYLLTATSGKLTHREIILVTDALALTRAYPGKVAVFAADARSGAPLAEAVVAFWERQYNSSKSEYEWHRKDGRTGADGLATFDVTGSGGRETFVAVKKGERVAVAVTNAQPAESDAAGWRVYVHTDRPAYRPEDTVKWKAVVRRTRGGVYELPGRDTIKYRLTDPRGTVIKEGSGALNAFGALWDEVALSADTPLGMYQIQFLTANNDTIGSASLFRLEEYKLPEFKVAVEPAEDGGKPRLYRPGDTLEATVKVEYYFGGAVANADVEIVVTQSPYYRYFPRDRRYPWFFEDENPWNNYGGGSEMSRQTLKTDAEGRAVVRVETEEGDGGDLQYRIEARVRDASRREVVGSGAVRVSSQRYAANLTTDHVIYRPQDRVTLNLVTRDVNDRPVRAEGRLRVIRDRWVEVWEGVDGKTRRWEAGTAYPTDFAKDRARCLRRGYESEEVLKQSLDTNEAGEGALTFAAPGVGYYRAVWEGADEPTNVIAQATLWVATKDQAVIGHQPGGLDILLDKDTVKAGGPLSVLVMAPATGRFVLFGVEAGGLESLKLLSMDGAVKMVEVPVGEKHIPNFFLSATMVSDYEISEVNKEVVVPPEDKFLTVEVKPDNADHKPGEAGKWTVTTKDRAGKPVPADVSFAVSDEAVSAIQADLAGDPRPFFYGQKRYARVRSGSTLGWRNFRLATGETNGETEGSMDDKGSALSGSMRARRSGGMALGGMKMKKSMARDEMMEEKSEMQAVPAPSVAKSGLAQEKDADSPGGEPAVQVRQNFSATAFWQPDLQTGADGEATVSMKFPDTLTSWQGHARAFTTATQVGEAKASVRTRAPLMVRLQAPRFFVVGDEVTLSALVNNVTDRDLSVQVSLAAGDGLSGPSGAERFTVPTGGEARLDRRFKVVKPGPVKVTAKAWADGAADAMEKTYPVYDHGIQKFLSKSGKVRGDNATIRLDLPPRREEGTDFKVRLSPSLAGTLLDALPYLIQYPYGCTEQTLSRFLPAVVVKKALTDLGLSPADIEGKMFGGLEPGAKEPKPDAQGRTPGLGELNKVVRAGLDRLYDFQHSDGGWGWWKEGTSDLYMTAYAVWGLTLTERAGVSIRTGVVEKGQTFLANNLVKAENSPELQAWMVQALAAAMDLTGKKKTALPPLDTALDNLWQKREKLGSFGRALTALAYAHRGNDERAKILAQNLENGLRVDVRPDTSVLEKAGNAPAELMQTAHWGQSAGYWRWWDGAGESTAFGLLALLEIDPTNERIEPVVNWLVKERRAGRWSNTRDTAYSILALTSYLQKSKELEGDVTVRILVNGRKAGEARFDAKKSLSQATVWKVERSMLKEGANEIRLEKSGARPVYFSVDATFFSLEEPIAAAGNELFVHRRYDRWKGKQTLLKGIQYQPELLADKGRVKSGERVLATLTLESKTDQEYLMIEDLKPAGLEAVQIQSGQPLYAREINPKTKVPTGRNAWVYQELRDRKVALFIDKLPQGLWELSYDLRAEAPGEFHALPTLGQAMYIPEIRGNGDEVRMTVED